MEIKELLQKLEPILGIKKCQEWWFVYLTEDAKGRKEIEQYLELRAIEAIGKDYDDDTILLPPPPKEIAEQGTYHVGKITYGNKPLYDFFLKEDEWLSHIAIVGRSGSGKTNLVLHLINQLILHQKPFWIFDFKRNYRDLLNTFNDLSVYTIGRNVANITNFNPLVPMDDPHNHIRRIVALICKAYFLGEGAYSLLVKCLDQLYQNFGVYSGNVEKYPTFANVLQWLESYKPKSGARDGQWLQSTLRAVKVLTFGVMGKAINSQQAFPLKEVLGKRIIFELDALSKQDKIFFLGLLLHYRHEYKLSNAEREKLQDVLVIEEAHHLLPKKSIVEEESILETLLREERELGTSIIVIDQLASRLSDIAFANTATTFGLNQKHKADINTIANAVLLGDEDKKGLSKLKIGYAIVRQQDRWPKPFLLKIPHFKIEKGSTTDEHVRKHMQTGNAIPAVNLPNVETHLIDENSLKLLTAIKENPTVSVVYHYKNAGLSAGTGNIAKRTLFGQGLILQNKIKNKNGQIMLLGLTKKGTFYLRLLTEKHQSKNSASPEHQYYQEEIGKLLETKGHSVQKEAQLDNCRPDLLIDKTIAIEIETGKSKRWLEHVNEHFSANRPVIIAATNKQAYDSILSELQKRGLYPNALIRIIIPKV